MRRVSFFLVFLVASTLWSEGLPSASAAKPYTLQELKTLKDVGYSEAQLLQELRQRGALGQYKLTPAQVLTLSRQGFSLRFLRALGLAKAAPATRRKAAPARRRQPAPARRRKAASTTRRQSAPSKRRQSAPPPSRRRSAPSKRAPSPARGTSSLGPYRPLPPAPSPTAQVRGWIQQLGAAAYAQRVQAVQQLARQGADAAAAVPALLQQLQLPNVVQFSDVSYIPTTKYKALVIQALGQIGPHAGAATLWLLSLLREPRLKPVCEKALARIVTDPRHGKQALWQALRQKVSGPGWIFAAEQLGRLGPKGAFAIPALVTIFSAPNVVHWHSSYFPSGPLKAHTARVLAAIGVANDAVFAGLLLGLNDATAKPFAAYALRRLFYRFRDGFSRWMRVLREKKNLDAMHMAAEQIAHWGPRAKAAVPVLLENLKSIRATWKTQALLRQEIHALQRIGPAASPAVPLLLALLKQNTLHKAAQRALSTLLTRLAPHKAALLQVLRDRDHTTGHLLVLAHLKKAPKTLKLALRPAMVPLLRWHKKANATVRQRAAEVLASLGQEALPALPALKRALQPQKGEASPPALRIAVAQAIGAMGPSARSALPALYRAINASRPVAQAVTGALDRILVPPLSALSTFADVLKSQGMRRAKIDVARRLAHLSLDPHVAAKATSQQRKQAAALWKNQQLLPQTLRSAGYANLAHQALQRQQTTLAKASLKQAIRRGYDDCLSLRVDALWKPLHSDADFRRLYQQIQITRADFAELMWLWRELSIVSHETSMMIVENMGRPDSASTRVPQTSIPARPTSSHAVWEYRRRLRNAQRRQKTMVLLSDMQRIQHNTSMMIIRSMGTGGNRRANQQRLRRLRSRMLANQRANRRQQQAQRRRFKLPAGATQQRRRCPALQTKPSPRLPQRQRYATTYTDAGKRHANAGNLAAASRSFARALQLDPTHAPAYRLRGLLVHLKQKAYRQAVADFHKALQHDPQHLSTLFWRALAYLSLEQYDKAHKDTDAVLQRNPKMAWAHNTKAVIHVRQGQIKQAYPHLLRALKLLPHNNLLLANQAYLLGKLGHYPQAEKVWEKAHGQSQKEAFLYVVAAYLTLIEPGTVALRREKALWWMEKALRAGFDEAIILRQETAFRALAPLPYYRHLKRTYLK